MTDLRRLAMIAGLSVGVDLLDDRPRRLPLPSGKFPGHHFTSEKPLSKRAKRRQRGKATR